MRTALLIVAVVTLFLPLPAIAGPALNPVVTPMTLDVTACVAGWTETVRPSSSQSHRKKVEILEERWETEATTVPMILDHIVPLCLGGSPSDATNLQLQSKAESKIKDRIERKLCCLVCTRQVYLETARAAMANDWKVAYRTYATMKCRRAKKPNVG